MDADNVIKIIFFIGFVLYKIFELGSKAKKKKGAAIEPSPAPAKKTPAKKRPVSTTQATTPQATVQRVQAPAASQGAQIQQRAQELSELVRKQIGLLVDRADARPESKPIAEAIRTWWIPELDSLSTQIRSSRDVDQYVALLQDAMLHRQLLESISAMVMQRQQAHAETLAEADSVIRACYAPVRQFADAHSVKLSTSQPLAVYSDWGLSIEFFDDSVIAPLNVPGGLRSSVWYWPAIAHEVAHDFYRSTKGLRQWLHQRTQLQPQMKLPAQYDGASIRAIFGPWLEEIFCDVLGALMMGPAYVDSMLVVFNQPDDPHAVRAAFGENGMVERHPPRDLRLYLALKTLDYLGYSDEANQLRMDWQDIHNGMPPLYYLPIRFGQLQPVPEHLVRDLGSQLLELMLNSQWAPLAQYPLISIPDLVYTHHDHAHVVALVPQVKKGQKVRGAARHIIAAAVMATLEEPDKEALILNSLHVSIVGVGEREKRAAVTSDIPVSAGGVAKALTSISGVRQAILLDAMISRR